MIILAVFGPSPQAVQILEMISLYYSVGMPALFVIGLGCWIAGR
ncbi:hypothetical protein [Bradyrhizobium sp. NAS80.1]|nr:hypothetical protein [Bradyrhizobium sp. NAS80.1]